jgi:hypothetical protein
MADGKPSANFSRSPEVAEMFRLLDGSHNPHPRGKTEHQVKKNPVPALGAMQAPPE